MKWASTPPRDARWFGWIRATSGRPKWKPSWATPPKLAKSSAGAQRSAFSELVAEMVESDLEAAKRDALVAKEGYKVYSHHE